MYEVRAGRANIQAEINAKFQAARQLGNDALYEARANRQKIEANFGNQLNSLKASLDNQARNIELKSQQQVNNLFNSSKGIINDAVSKANLAQSQTKGLQQQLSSLQATVAGLKAGNLNPQLNLNIESTVNRLIANSPQIQGLLAALNAANVKLNGFDIGFPVLADGIKNLGTSFKLADGRITRLEQGVEVKGLNVVNARIDGLQGAVVANKLDIQKLDTSIKERANVDKNALIKLDQLLGFVAPLPLLIGKVPSQTIQGMPRPLTAPQIEAATTAGVCRSTQNGGCMRNALGDAANTINQNTNNWGNNLLNGLNAGANATQLALLTKIDGKLGAQVVGGLSAAVGKNLERINKFAEWVKIDRVLNILTYVNTLHNAYMLSSSITDTLFSAIDNVSNIFFKDIDGVEIDSKKAVSIYFDNMAKAVFGVKEWNNITTTIKKYNRIYQAGANIVNSVRSMVDSIRNISEFIAENTGKIGNALMKFGAIGDRAFPWMPEQVNAQSIWMQRLENLEEAASGIEMITGEVLQITENVNEIKKQKEGFEKSIEDLAPKERPDNKVC
ncbi:MAG: hypothetical protein HC907_35785 [Richelia sp. SM1_7_0]|nr:hypothetical protein [Richelia sp. SM1_7_0]